MQGPGGRIVVNPAFEEWVYEDEKPTMVIPVKRQTTHYVKEEIAQSNSANDGRKKQQLQGSYKYGKVVSTHSSSRVLLLLVAFLCVMSIAAIVLNLLMLFGKIGYNCGCTDDQLVSTKALALGPDDKILDRVRVLEENATSLRQELLNTTAIELQLRDEGLYWEIENANSSLHTKINETVVQLQNSDQNLQNAINITKRTLCDKIDQSYVMLQNEVNNTRKQLQQQDNELTRTLYKVNDTLEAKLNATAIKLQLRDKELYREVQNANSSLQAKLDGDIAALQRVFTSTIATLQSSLSGLQMNVTEVRDKLNELIAMLQS